MVNQDEENLNQEEENLNQKEEENNFITKISYKIIK